MNHNTNDLCQNVFWKVKAVAVILTALPTQRQFVYKIMGLAQYAQYDLRYGPVGI